MLTLMIAGLALSVVACGMNRVLCPLCSTRLTRRPLFRRVNGVLSLLIILVPAVVNAHGTVALEDDPCVRRVGGNLIHFNAYQPQHEPKAQYCTDIPGEGDTYLVVDLLDPTLRSLPVGVRVIRGMSETAEGQTIATWPPALHPDGVLRGEAKLTKGIYQVIITPEGFSPSSYPLRVQQINYANVGRQAIGPLTLLLLLGLLGYELSKSTRLRDWWASGRTEC